MKSKIQLRLNSECVDDSDRDSSSDGESDIKHCATAPEKKEFDKKLKQIESSRLGISARITSEVTNSSKRGRRRSTNY